MQGGAEFDAKGKKTLPSSPYQGEDKNYICSPHLKKWYRKPGFGIT